MLANQNVEKGFAEHDLSAMYASDTEPLVHTYSLLAHADKELTQHLHRRLDNMSKTKKNSVRIALHPRPGSCAIHRQLISLWNLARPEGIEPPTHSLEVRCSNAYLCQLIKTLQALYCAIDSLVVTV